MVKRTGQIGKKWSNWSKELVKLVQLKRDSGNQASVLPSPARRRISESRGTLPDCPSAVRSGTAARGPHTHTRCQRRQRRHLHRLVARAPPRTAQWKLKVPAPAPAAPPQRRRRRASVRTRVRFATNAAKRTDTHAHCSETLLRSALPQPQNARKLDLFRKLFLPHKAVAPQ